MYIHETDIYIHTYLYTYIYICMYVNINSDNTSYHLSAMQAYMYMHAIHECKRVMYVYTQTWNDEIYGCVQMCDVCIHTDID